MAAPPKAPTVGNSAAARTTATAAARKTATVAQAQAQQAAQTATVAEAQAQQAAQTATVVAAQTQQAAQTATAAQAQTQQAAQTATASAPPPAPKMVYLQDVATVDLGNTAASSISRTNGKPSLSLVTSNSFVP